MEVLGVGATPRGAMLLIRERDGAHRVLPVAIGLPEAVAIEMELQHGHTPRPLTHQLIARVVEGFGRRLDHVEVTALSEGIFYAELILDQGVRISARVSDAVAIALHQRAPIQAVDEVLDVAGTTELTVVRATDPPAEDAEEDPEEQVAQFLEELDHVDPEDFGPG
jgi:uncharacterized protein